MTNVLISSGGRRGALVGIWRGALAALGLDGRVLVADASPLTAAGHLADELLLVPRVDDPSFVDAMLSICRDREVGLIVPTIDPELEVYARHRDRFSQLGIVVLVSEPPVVALGNDKLATHRWLAGEGFPTPPTALAAEADPSEAWWRLPLFAKPRRGSASIGAFAVTNDLELERARTEPDLLLQPIAAGVEHTVDVWVDAAGTCRAVVPRRRLEVRAGEVAKGVTVKHPALQALVRNVVARLPGRPFGALNVQCFVDGDAVTVVEINARFGGGYPLTHRAGADFARWALEERNGLASTASDTWAEGVVMLRYDDAVFVDADEAGLTSVGEPPPRS